MNFLIKSDLVSFGICFDGLDGHVDLSWSQYRKYNNKLSPILLVEVQLFDIYDIYNYKAESLNYSTQRL